MAARCAEDREFTYAVEPRSPSSSAPHQPNRRCRVGRKPERATASATSRLAAEPLPLSLMPGPAVTLSRGAPTEPVRLWLRPGPAVTLARWARFRRVRPVSPRGQWAIRLYPVAPP